jgi:hypothetical protein
VTIIETEVVDDEQLDRDELAQLELGRIVEAGVPESLEHVIGAQREDRVATATSDVAERVREIET